MLPKFYQNCLENQLSPSQYITLQLLVWLLQTQKTVQIEKLAAVLSIPVKYESRRRHLQRFLVLPKLRVKLLWFPLVKKWLKIHYQKGKRLKVVIDRTQWKKRNLFVVSLLWEKRSYVLRTKEGKYYQQDGQNYQLLSTLGLAPGKAFYLGGIKLTKQKGFGGFNLVGYCSRKSAKNEADEGWYLLTNLTSLKMAVKTYQARYGIEAMFKDCKSGGYNLEKCQALI